MTGPGGPTEEGADGSPASFEVLEAELREAFARGPDDAFDRPAFDEMALRVFRFQFRENPVYRRFCEGRGATPDTVADPDRIPAVPTSAFKHLPLVSGDPRAVEAVFRTSGTTRVGRRGTHRVRSLALYRASALPTLGAYLLPGDETLPVLSLLPHPSRAPDASLSRMIAFLVDETGRSETSGWFVDPEEGVQVGRLLPALEAARDRGDPVLLAATAFSLVHLLDRMEADRRTIALPEGSRLLETGGFKGRSREVERGMLYEGVRVRLGIPESRIVNEYGMTELLSQLYEPVLTGGCPADPDGRFHRGPSWLRTTVVDARTLEPVPPGERGLLRHHDLANLGSVAPVLTEDVGVAVDGGVRLLGRARGAEPRGCSLALEEILEATEGTEPTGSAADGAGAGHA